MYSNTYNRYGERLFSAGYGQIGSGGRASFQYVLGNARGREMGRPGEPVEDRTAPKIPLEHGLGQPDQAEGEEDDVNDRENGQESDAVGFDEEVPGNRQRDRKH